MHLPTSLLVFIYIACTYFSMLWQHGSFLHRIHSRQIHIPLSSWFSIRRCYSQLDDRQNLRPWGGHGIWCLSLSSFRCHCDADIWYFAYQQEPSCGTMYNRTHNDKVRFVDRMAVWRNNFMSLTPIKLLVHALWFPSKRTVPKYWKRYLSKNGIHNSQKLNSISTEWKTFNKWLMK